MCGWRGRVGEKVHFAWQLLSQRWQKQAWASFIFFFLFLFFSCAHGLARVQCGAAARDTLVQGTSACKGGGGKRRKRKKHGRRPSEVPLRLFAGPPLKPGGGGGGRKVNEFTGSVSVGGGSCEGFRVREEDSPPYRGRTIRTTGASSQRVTGSLFFFVVVVAAALGTFHSPMQSSAFDKHRPLFFIRFPFPSSNAAQSLSPAHLCMLRRRHRRRRTRSAHNFSLDNWDGGRVSIEGRCGRRYGGGGRGRFVDRSRLVDGLGLLRGLLPVLEGAAGHEGGEADQRREDEDDEERDGVVEVEELLQEHLAADLARVAPEARVVRVRAHAECRHQDDEVEPVQTRAHQARDLAARLRADRVREHRQARRDHHHVRRRHHVLPAVDVVVAAQRAEEVLTVHPRVAVRVGRDADTVRVRRELRHVRRLQRQVAAAARHRARQKADSGRRQHARGNVGRHFFFVFLNPGRGVMNQ
eukprot:Rhum_TRINITY_DN14425_c12_g2::Rhum_TRINITY_DN14425_c12_g2_i1::g.90095::m.90095